MNEASCPTCGHPLPVDVLSGEVRPCARCGSAAAAKPVPDPEHQQRIHKQKGFEIGAIIVMIVVGAGYLAVSRGGFLSRGDSSATVANLSKIVEAQDFNFTGESLILGRRFLSYRQEGRVFQNSIDLIADAESEAVEAILVVVKHPGGKPFPPDDVAEASIQKALNSMARLGEKLIPSAALALEKAAATTSLGQGDRLHRKGVAQTSDGWKVTYVAYREYEENGEDIPLLLFLYQRLSAASSPELAEFNRALYRAIGAGTDPTSSLRALEKRPTGG